MLFKFITNWPVVGVFHTWCWHYMFCVLVKLNLCVWGESFGFGYLLKTCEVTGTSYSFEDISHYEQLSVQHLSS